MTRRRTPKKAPAPASPPLEEEEQEDDDESGQWGAIGAAILSHDLTPLRVVLLASSFDDLSIRRTIRPLEAAGLRMVIESPSNLCEFGFELPNVIDEAIERHKAARPPRATSRRKR